MRLNDADFEAITAQLANEMAEIVGAVADATPHDPGVMKPPAKRKTWEPLHGPTQKKIMRDQAEVVGACAEKGTGKTFAFADKIIAHCYLGWDALAVIIGNSHRALAEGICQELTTFSLPRWRDGNREPLYNEDEKGNLIENPKAGELMDAGIGLEYTGWKSDPNNKDLYLKIRNQFGGWSRIRVIAIPFGKMVQSRVTNLNASLFYLEEATRCDGREYYDFTVGQLNRRRQTKGVQPFLFSCNPDDPKNWVYEWMYTDVVVAKDQPGRVWPDDPEKPGIRRDIDVGFYYLPFRENRRNLSKKYIQVLAKAWRANPIMRDRLLKGKWIAMPAGDALFKGEFSERLHMRGDLEKGLGLAPVPGHPIVIGMDWGARSVGIVFRQIIESEDGPFKITFDSISFYQEMHKTRQLARAILEKMRYWNIMLRRERDWDEETAPRDEHGHLIGVPSWCWWFITGDDATTNYNPETGNINARDLQDHMREIIEEEPNRYLGIEVPVIRGCPRPEGSVAKRIDIVAEDLMSEMAVISEFCEDVKGMFNNLTRDKDKPSHPAKGNRWIHILDGYSYPDYYRRFVLPRGFYNFDEGPAVDVA